MMKMLISNVLIALVFMISGCSAKSASSSEWMQDFEEAKKRAALESKDILLNFSGSDWCGWCIKLQQEVFSQENFKKEAEKHFVLVELDFPQRGKQSEKIRNQNQKLVQKYRIIGFPTILVTDSEGRPYARTGYIPGGPDKFISFLEKVRSIRIKRERLLAEADKARGLERARLLDQVVNLMAENSMEIDPAIVNQIKKLDINNEAGLKHKYEVHEGIARIMGEIGQDRDFDKALTKLDELMDTLNPGPGLKQDVYFIKAEICFQGKNDIKAGIENLKKAERIAPNSKKGLKISEIIKQIEESQ
jgi:thioredoxin-related protein